MLTAGLQIASTPAAEAASWKIVVWSHEIAGYIYIRPPESQNKHIWVILKLPSESALTKAKSSKGLEATEEQPADLPGYLRGNLYTTGMKVWCFFLREE